MQKNTVAMVANPVASNSQKPQRCMRLESALLNARDSHRIPAMGSAKTNAPLAIMCSRSIVPPK
jgi:hypothetical protein